MNPEPTIELSIETQLKCADDRIVALEAQNEVLRAEVDRLGRELDDAEPPTYPGHPDFHTALDEMRHLHVVKSGGYGTTADPFANFTAVAAVAGQARAEYPLDRIVEKVTRAKSLIAQGRWGEVGEEFCDIAGLALCAEACRREDERKVDAFLAESSDTPSAYRVDL